MFSRILLGVVGAVAGVIVIVVSAASAAPDDDPGADAASSPLPQLTVAPPTDYPDVRLLNGDAFSNQAAFDPIEPKRLVVGIASGRECYVRRSTDGGRTWGPLVQLPQLAGAECGYARMPSVTYTATGSRLYAAYVYNKSFGVSGIAFSVSTDQGATWSSPRKVFREYNNDYESAAGFEDVRLAVAPDGPEIYAVGYLTGGHGEQDVLFSSSRDQGASWTPEKVIAVGGGFDEPPELYGFTLAAGRKGNVFVSYGIEECLSGCIYRLHRLQVARSADHGASFLYGTADQSDDFVGNPDIKIGPFGTAHLVYEKGGAILYKYSFPPYGTWSAEPVRLDDHVPQANVDAPRLAVGACGQASILHATWLEYLGYWPSKILYTRKVAQPGYAWSEPLKVGTLKNGIWKHGLAAAGPKAFSIFSGRTAPYPQDEWAIFGSRISSGVTCP